MNSSSFILILMLFTLSSNAHALELLVGIVSADQDIWIAEKNGSTNAIVRNPTKYQPTIGLRSEEGSFSDESNWGYFYEVNYARFELSLQETSSGELADYDTGLSGWGLYAIPVGYYHFNKGKPEEWSYKAGIGVGLGYLNMSGSFVITEPSHLNYNQRKKVDAKGIDMAVAIYLEVSKGPHTFLIENYSPTIEDDKYSYQFMNVGISYKYAFQILDIATYFNQ